MNVSENVEALIATIRSRFNISYWNGLSTFSFDLSLEELPYLNIYKEALFSYEDKDTILLFKYTKEGKYTDYHFYSMEPKDFHKYISDSDERMIMPCYAYFRVHKHINPMFR